MNGERSKQLNEELTH